MFGVDEVCDVFKCYIIVGFGIIEMMVGVLFD